MDLHEARTLCLNEMARHGLIESGWSFRWKDSIKCLGECVHGTVREIRLSRPYVACNPREVVLDTILHEIAHALAGPKAGHGPLWRATCVAIGAKPERCKSEAADERFRPPPGRYAARCRKCGQLVEHFRSRPSSERWSRRYHTPCGPDSRVEIVERRAR